MKALAKQGTLVVLGQMATARRLTVQTNQPVRMVTLAALGLTLIARAHIPKAQLVMARGYKRMDGGYFQATEFNN